MYYIYIFFKEYKKYQKKKSSIKYVNENIFNNKIINSYTYKYFKYKIRLLNYV